MKCNVCEGTGKVYVRGIDPDSDLESEKCDECKGTGERNIVLTITLWDEDNEREIKSENVSVDYEQGAEAIARLVKYAQEN